MTDNYIEQPAFESNEFKEGDRVAVYQSCEGVITNVRKVKDHMVKVWDPLRDSTMDYHFKQCRLLKRIEPREWLVLVHNGELVTQKEAKEIEASRSVKVAVIKVREVLKDG